MLKLVDDHRAYLRGAVDATLSAVRDGDPFVKNGVAQYELPPWVPGIGKDDLDRL